MAFKLITLTNGGVSLEFDQSDLPIVVEAITALYGTPVMRKQVLCELWEFGGGELIYYNEWDPCLIAQSEESNEALQNLNSVLGERQSG
ncbi:hypothetical protein [Aliiroseovarius marinus]|uniref:hypothetical protein n=1 Tax=Aliiroseovarius marinus TaxID=2500159 RepID=UPI0010611B5C|nr:hypothetical protein [Aliiroseovarius marinus]